MSRSLLITGAAGFIGANFAHYWARAYPGDRLVALSLIHISEPTRQESRSRMPSSA